MDFSCWFLIFVTFICFDVSVRYYFLPHFACSMCLPLRAVFLSQFLQTDAEYESGALTCCMCPLVMCLRHTKCWLRIKGSFPCVFIESVWCRIHSTSPNLFLPSFPSCSSFRPSSLTPSFNTYRVIPSPKWVSAFISQLPSGIPHPFPQLDWIGSVWFGLSRGLIFHK